MYRIKMLCYDEQNKAPYEDVSLECYKTEQDAKKRCHSDCSTRDFRAEFAGCR